MERAEQLYQAYGRSTNFKNFQGNPMPKWADLPDAIKEAWRAVADEQISVELDEREQALVERAKEYRQESFALRQNRELHLLIAKLAEALGV